jgi:hypothetical protein
MADSVSRGRSPLNSSIDLLSVSLRDALSYLRIFLGHSSANNAEAIAVHNCIFHFAKRQPQVINMRVLVVAQ